MTQKEKEKQIEDRQNAIIKSVKDEFGYNTVVEFIIDDKDQTLLQITAEVPFRELKKIILKLRIKPWEITIDNCKILNDIKWVTVSEIQKEERKMYENMFKHFRSNT